MICSPSQAVSLVMSARMSAPVGWSLLVGISGIDGSGKGYVAGQLTRELEMLGYRVATINVDGWLQPPDKRFDPARPAEHFYQHGIRFEEMFSRLILPLRDQRSLRLTAQLSDATNQPYLRDHTYEFDDVDIILLEGIFLLREPHRAYFDLSFWIECSFETALERALLRGQENLPEREVIRDYNAIYFPAQRLHLKRDQPRQFATARIINDPRIESGESAASAIRMPQTSRCNVGASAS